MNEIDEALGIENGIETIVVLPKSPVTRDEGNPNPTIGNIVDDFWYARKNIHNAMDKSGALLESAMIAVAESGGAPRTIEVAAMLLKQCGDTSKDLLNLAKLAQDLAPTDNNESEERISLTAKKLSEMLDDNVE